jgi:hypothetical protein
MFHTLIGRKYKILYPLARLIPLFFLMCCDGTSELRHVYFVTFRGIFQRNYNYTAIELDRVVEVPCIC